MSPNEIQDQDSYRLEEAAKLTADNVNEKCDNPLISTEHSYDQTLEIIGIGKFNYAVLVFTGVSMMVVISEGHCMSFALPAAKCDLNMSTAEQGFTNSVGYIGVVLSSHFWGFLADTWGRRKVLRAALFLSFVTALVSSFSLNSWMLMTLRLTNGLSVAGIKGTGITYMGEFISNKNRPRFLAFLSSFMAFTIVMQSLLGLALLTQTFEWKFFNGFVYKPWRMFVMINSLLAGFGFFGLMLLPESPKFLLAMGKPNDALNIMRKMYAFNSGRPIETFSVHSITALESTGMTLSEVNGFKGVLLLIWNQTKPLFCPPYLNNMLLICTLFYAYFLVVHGQEMWYPQILTYYSKNMNLAITTCEAISMGYMPVATKTSANITSAMNVTINLTSPASCNKIIHPLTFIVTVTMGLCFVVFNTSAGLAVTRFGKKRLLISWLIISMFSGLALIWTNHLYVNIVFTILHLSTIVCCTVMCGVFGDLFPTHLRTMALNTIIMFQRLGSVSGSSYVAAMIFGYCTTMYTINFFIMLGALCIAYIMLRKSEGTLNMNI